MEEVACADQRVGFARSQSGASMPGEEEEVSSDFGSVAKSSAQCGTPGETCAVAPAVGPRSWRRRRYFNPRESGPDGREVIASGVLQRCSLGFFWRPRWCVLDNEMLSVYQSEAHWLRAPNQTLECFDLGHVTACRSPTCPRVFHCLSVDSCRELVRFRVGDQNRWEEVASCRLWAHMLTTASSMRRSALEADKDRPVHACGLAVHSAKSRRASCPFQESDAACGSADQCGNQRIIGA